MSYQLQASFLRKKPEALDLFMPDSRKLFGLFQFMTSNCPWQQSPGLWCAKENGSSGIVHAQLSRIIRAVFVWGFKLSMSTSCLRNCLQKRPATLELLNMFFLMTEIVHDNSRSLLCERDRQFSNCSSLANYSDSYCLWNGSWPGLFVHKRYI